MTSNIKHPMITPMTVAIETGSENTKSNPAPVFEWAAAPHAKLNKISVSTQS